MTLQITYRSAIEEFDYVMAIARHDLSQVIDDCRLFWQIIDSREAREAYRMIGQAIGLAICFAICCGSQVRAAVDELVESSTRTDEKQPVPDSVIESTPKPTEPAPVVAVAAPMPTTYTAKVKAKPECFRYTNKELRKMCQDAGIKYRWRNGKKNKYLTVPQMMEALGL